MQDTSKREIGLVIAVIVIMTILVFAFPGPKGKVYDCSLSEISPDYPLEVKESCRKLRAENFNKTLQKPK